MHHDMETDAPPSIGSNWVNKEDLYQFLEQAQQDKIGAEQNFGSFVIAQLKQTSTP